MKQSLLVLLFVLTSSTLIFAQTYPEVWFENSGLPIRYSNSATSYEGNSWIKNIKKQIPVSESVFFTPNNALELNYTSAKDGNWTADIFYQRTGDFRIDEGTILTFKFFVQSDTDSGELPAIEIRQAHPSGDSVSRVGSMPLKRFIKKLERNKWMTIYVPLKVLGMDDPDQEIESIRFSQSAKDGKRHVVFVDQIEVLSERLPKSPLTNAAVLSSLTGYERHVDITWNLPLTPSIKYIKFYRSTDSVNFTPVAIRPIFTKKYADIVTPSDSAYFYKITWMDYYYRESPFSNVMEVKTKKLNNQKLLEIIQRANISYFLDGEEFNSGMQLRNISYQSSVVSVKNTGVGILALITGVKNDFALREKVFKRVEKVVSFLNNAESFHGVYPELLDGRSGKAVLNRNEKRDSINFVVDLESSGILMQSLLVAKQYFNKENEEEVALREGITNLWRRMEWNAFLKSGRPYLFSQLSSDGTIQDGTPLSGLSKMYLYIMALASPKFNIELEQYNEVLKNPLKLKVRELSYRDSLVEDNLNELASLMHINEQDFHATSYRNQNTYYGVPLQVGNVDDNLTDILMGFMALDPTDKVDAYANYGDNIKNLIEIQYRQSVENGDEMVLSKLDVSKGIAIYPFYQKMAMKNMRDYYINHAETLWKEYGFIATIDFKQNRIVYPKEGVNNGLNAVMIENGKNGLIWKLFMQDHDINEVVKVVFKN